MLHVAVIGCGKIAQVRHLPEFAANPDVRLAGYYDFDRKRAEEMAEKYGGKAYRSVEELLAEPSIDAVSVCVANNAHAEISIAALNAGKHVLCEKPMAVTLKDCEAMVEASRKNKRFLMIDQNQRLARAHVKAKELLEQGIIGDVVTFRTTFGHGGPETWSIDPGRSNWFFDKKLAAMGALADLGVHKTDLIQFLLGKKVVATTARIATLEKRDANGEPIGVDDNAMCIYRMENGIVGTMTVSWTFYGREDNSTVLYGTKGIMRIYDDPVHSIVIDFRNGERAMYDLGGIQTNDTQTKSGVIDAFVDSLVKNEEPAISGSSVLPAMRAVFASIESSKTGRTVEIAGSEGKGQ